MKITKEYLNKKKNNINQIAPKIDNKIHLYEDHKRAIYNVSATLYIRYNQKHHNLQFWSANMKLKITFSYDIYTSKILPCYLSIKIFAMIFAMRISF